ncbi:MAG: PDZ domain-containing protein [Candidatus Hydrogenedentes bacterium]|nr:PDZ domain-containing protein [Candidatus Hydrogenedentota bacterium]
MQSRYVRSTLLFLTAATISFAQDAPDSVRSAVDVAIAKVKPALVRIGVVWTDYNDGREEKYEASGSGTIVTGEGHVVTNHHVAGHATRIFCTLSTKEIIEADLIGKDPQTDIAVIKLKGERGRIFPTAEFADSSELRVGDIVLAMGSPLSLSQSVTQGIVSNTELVFPARRFGSLTLDGEDVGSLIRWIGHDAPIYPGNSGGPLVNIRGQIVGVNEISIGLGGAIPGNIAKDVTRKLISSGKVERAWIGLNMQPQLKTDVQSRGVLVRNAFAGSPADQAGFKAGDLFTSIAGNDITVRFEEQLPLLNALIASLPIGQPLEATVVRDGKEERLTVTPIPYQEVEPDQDELKEWGVTARNVSFVNAREMKRDTTDGVLITSVRPGGPTGTAKPEINRQDIIVGLNGQPVKDMATLKELTAKILEGQKDPVPVLVEFERKVARLQTVVKVGIAEPPDPGKDVEKAWLAVDTQVITRDIATQVGNPDLKGFRLTQVYPGTTAESAGLKVGDFIYAVDGEPLEAAAPEDYEELTALVRQYKIGSTAEFGVLRGSEKLKIPVQLTASPRQTREMKEYEDFDFEFKVRDLTFIDKVKEKWPEDKAGALVSKIEPGGWAAVANMDPSDLIVKIGGSPIANVDDVEKKMKEIKDSKAESAIFQVERGVYTVFLEFEPKWDAAPAAGKD